MNIKKRIDHQIILDLIPNNCSILDLGSGDGTLIDLLRTEKKNIKIQGIEINAKSLQQSLLKGINAVQQDLDGGLNDFKDKSFDFVILNKTLQATHKPLLVLKEAIRIGKKVLISFPNFGYWIVRSQLFFFGKMPKSRDLPYEWYDTPNIHLVTISDFRLFCEKYNFQIQNQFFYDDENLLPAFCPNLCSPYALFVLSNKSN